MIVTIDLLGNKHTIQRCTTETSVIHFDKIKKYIPNHEIKGFLHSMHECITLNTAFAISDNSCFIYYKNYENCFATGIALYGKNSPMKMLALLAGIFREIDKETFKIDFSLHQGKFVDEYKSLITMTSIKQNDLFNTPLVIRVDHLKQKIHKLHQQRGLIWEV